MKERTIYECDYCGSTYIDETKCEACETKCKKSQDSFFIKEFNKNFPSRYPGDGEFVKHCVLCGDPNISNRPFMNGRMCGECIKNSKIKIGKALVQLEIVENENGNEKGGNEKDSKKGKERKAKGNS